MILDVKNPMLFGASKRKNLKNEFQINRFRRLAHIPFDLCRPFSAISLKFTKFRLKIGRAHPHNTVVRIECDKAMIIRHRHHDYTSEAICERYIGHGAHTIALPQAKYLVFASHQTAGVTFFAQHSPTRWIQRRFCKRFTRM